MSLPAFPDDWQRALVLMAHPDDPEYGLAPAVHHWTQAGKSVAYVLATAGEAGIDGLAPGQCGPARQEEQRRAAAHVGVSEVEFLGFPDGRLEASLDLRRALAAAIRRHRPDVVITMFFGVAWEGKHLNSPDHRALGLSALDAVGDAANAWIHEGLEGEPWQGVQHVAVIGDEPTHTVDVRGSVQAAILSLSEHRQYLEALSDEPVEEQARAQVENVTGADTGKAAVGLRLYG